MDERRLSTGDLLSMGILGMRAPQTEIPKDREQVDGEDDGFIGVEAVTAALEAGKVVKSSNYYGIPYAWKQADGVYRGTLLQYRAVTANPTFATAAECAEWFKDTHYATDG